MGRDKASIRLPRPVGRLGPAEEEESGGARAGTLAERTGLILHRSCSPVLEVGPGHSGLRCISEQPPGAGPLAAVAAGWEAFRADGWYGPVVVVATDLPNLTDAMVAWLAARPGERSVVPVASGRVQPLCARYSPSDLDRAVALVGSGRRAMTALLEVTDPHLVGEEEWAPAAGGTEVLIDVDTPDDLHQVTDL